MTWRISCFRVYEHKARSKEVRENFSYNTFWLNIFVAHNLGLQIFFMLNKKFKEILQVNKADIVIHRLYSRSGDQQD